MHVEERHAAAAYTYAWWMSGDEDAATAALRAALRAPDPASDGDLATQIALVEAVRAELGDSPTMYPASQVALLHDGLGLPLDAAADIAGVPADETGFALAHGRLEALLETVREGFDHPERLGGLATESPADIKHARRCPSCARARGLIERGRTELRAVAPVSAPPGVLAQLVAEASPAVPDAAIDGTAVRDHDVLDAPQDHAVAGDDIVDEDVVLDEPAAAEADVVVGETPAAAPTAPPAAPPAPVEPRRVPATPTRRRLAPALAAGGLVTACVLIAYLVSQSGPQESPEPAVQPPPVAQEPTEEPAVEEPAPEETPTGDFGPAPDAGREFAVLDAGVLLSGESEMAPSGTTIGREDPIRIAVDYANATEGVTLAATWRVDDEPFQRLTTVVTGERSRHVWGLPQPPDGWPRGRHRIVLSADGSVAGAIDFTVRNRST